MRALGPAPNRAINQDKAIQLEPVTLAIVGGGAISARESEHQVGVDACSQPTCDVIDSILTDRCLVWLEKSDVCH
jgi:hypothetical protein